MTSGSLGLERPWWKSTSAAAVLVEAIGAAEGELSTSTRRSEPGTGLAGAEGEAPAGISGIGMERVARVELTLYGSRVRRLCGSGVSTSSRSSGSSWVERKEHCQL